MKVSMGVIYLTLLLSEVYCSCSDIERMVCPMGCRCTDVELDCQLADLDAIPDPLPHSIQNVFLSGNKITEVTREHFKGCKQLRELHLGANKISSIDQHAFDDLKIIKKLYLNDNMLYNYTLSTQILSQLRSLAHLEIDNKHLRYDTIYFGKILANLEHLETLHITGNINVTDWSPIIRLKNLTTFHLYDHIEMIYNETFRMFSLRSAPQIQSFGVHSIKLTSVEALSFVHFKHLKMLDLSFNIALGFHNMSIAWYGLQERDIRELRLEACNPFETQTINLREDFFQYLDKTRITKLILDGNSIVFFAPVFHQYLPHLEYLSMAYNRFQNHAYGFMLDLHLMKNLTHLDVSHQSRRKFYPKLEQYRPTYTSSNVGERSDPAFDYGHHYINYGGARLQDEKTHINRFSYKVYGPSALRTLLLAECLTLYVSEIPEVLIHGCSELEYIDYSNNNFNKWIGPLDFNCSFERPLTLIMQSCQGRYMSPTFLNNAVIGTNQTVMKLGKLDISHNKFGSQIERDANGSAWLQFKDADLGELHLADNGIRHLQLHALNNLQAVRVLNLSDNALRVVNATLTHMQNLTCLDLSNNLLHTINENTREELDTITGQGALLLNLTGNPLLCNCETLPFLHWMKETKVKLVSWNNYKCSFGEKIVDLTNLESLILPELNLLCASKVLLITAGASVSVALLMVAVSICIYRHRWDIKYLCMRLSRKRKAYQLLQQENVYKYDAFVAYSSEDISWVRHQLLPNLEMEGPEPRFRLCVHHRDWQPGVPIEENIEDSIESSRKTILVITNKFASSAWTEFETRVARGRSIEERLDLIVAIMLEDVPVEMMNKTLYRIVRKDTYIKWPAFDEDHRETVDFWDKMRAALRAPCKLQ